MDVVVASYGDLDNFSKDFNKKSVEVLEDKGRNKIVSYLNNYEFCHKMYKIAIKSGLQATRSGRKLYIGFEYSGKKYELDYDSYNDFALRKVTDKNNNDSVSIDKVDIKELAESVNSMEDILNKSFNLSRLSIDLFKREEVEEEEDSRL